VKSINIISFDVPYPPNYGGIIDVFYKIKFFHSKGISVHLHCFEYGKGKQVELEKYCNSVNYYKRKTGIISFFSLTPYIVKSRSSIELKNNLLKNDYPILFEGLHSCFLLGDKDLNSRTKIFRESNIEHDYYRHLAFAEKNPLKRFYFLSEAKKLQYFEAIIKNADISYIVSLSDLDYFESKYPENSFVFVPSFHSSDIVSSKPGIGDYILYHGNLSVAENIEAVKFIVNDVFRDLEIPLIISGLNPTKEVVDLARKYNHIELIKNPDDKKMQELISNAQINLLYTNQATGLKLKLLNVLFNGRHCIVNSKMVEGTSLGEICIIENDAQKLKELVLKTFKQEFSIEEKDKRAKVLQKNYSNEKSYSRIIESLNKLK